MTKDHKIAVVAPNHKIPSSQWIDSLKAATEHKAWVIIVDDSPEQNLKEYYLTAIPKAKVYNRVDQKEILGDKYAQFAIFHKSSACRNFGNYMAWVLGHDIIIGLDSDCNVPEGFVDRHVYELENAKAYGWTNPIKIEGWFPRGYPYSERERKVISNLGLWTHVLDINAKDRNENEPISPDCIEGDVNYSEGNRIAESFIPYSGMNWAMWSHAIPGFLFLPNFNFEYKDEDWRFRRHDDIWGGYIFQKLMELRNERIAYGNPMVYHDTVIDKQADMDEENAMIEFETTFYSAVDRIAAQLEVSTYEDMFHQFALIAEKNWGETEWQPLIAALKWWSDVFGDTDMDNSNETRD